ncbi:MAG: fused MFS/spermidine synthase [Candidatus Parvarchaeota archaeon]|nr:fused MFS/spermidine synthase [Candidatus Parvarchaeota archaeon]MCL5420227.1 fused MFS/spermidine synthase [Candidatus Parvarchaeota archaeon]
MNVINKIIERIKGEKIIKTEKDDKKILTLTKGPDGLSVKFNGITYSRRNENKLFTGSYWDYFTPLPLLYQKSNILMIGLGGGTIVYQINRLYGKKVQMDVVEIDEKMIELAEDFIPEDIKKVNLFLEDGIKFLNRNKKKYELVFLDAYDGDKIPDEFLDEKTVESINNALTEEGVLAINYAMSFKAIVFLQNYINKLKKYFKVYLVNNPLGSGNTIILCSKKMDKKEILEKVNQMKLEEDNANVLKGYNNMSNG